VKAIKIRDEHAQFMANECVECGQCLESCPQNAIVFMKKCNEIHHMLEEGKPVVVSLAPAYLGVFGDAEPDQMATALRELGFTYVHETAEAAGYVTEAYINYCEQSRAEDVLLTSSCSAINNLIEKYHPDMIPYLMPVVTPAIAHARMLREQYGPDAKIIYISPCVADGGDALQDPRTKGLIDAVVDFATLRNWLRARGIKIPECSKSHMDSIDPKVMHLYAVSGGVLSALKASKGRAFKHKRLYVSGIGDCEELFECIRNGEISNCVIELNSCVGGCINGPMTGGKKSDRFRAKISVSQKVNEHEIPDLPPLSEKIDLSKKFVARSEPRSVPSDAEIRAILTKIGKDSPEKELNCGACGFPTCREKAIAYYRGKTEMTMCVPYMYEKARNMSDVILSVTPNMVLVVDRDLLICEFNNAAEVVFGLSQEQALGKPISEIISPEYFEQVFREQRSVINQRVDYDQYNIKTMQNIIYMREQEQALVIMRDITEAVREQEQLRQVKLDTVAMAQNVINKQMMVAQEIAGLLGETTAETKSTLRKLRDTLMAGDEDLKI
jgi:PAS domain S-box-containing protein